MSRRKQAKPRLWKREEEEEDDDASIEQLTLTAVCESGSLGDENDLKEDNNTEDNFISYSREYLSKNSELKDEDQFEHFLQDDENSLDSDTLGTEGGSSWVSEDHTTSPGSSCATPNSTTEAPDSELSFTVGVTDVTPHACRFCDKAFPRHSYLKKHEQTHVDCMPFRCEYCRRLFKHKRSRDRHIKLHTGDKKYKCTQCDAAFSRSDHLKIHMKTHDNQKPFQCTICNRGYNTAAALTSHMQNHKRSSENSASVAPPGTTFKCLQCAEIFRKPEELQNHMNSHQSSDSASNTNGKSKALLPTIRLICTYCTKDNFSSMEALQSHVQSVHKFILNGDLQRVLSSQEKSTPIPAPISSNSLNSPSPLHTSQSFSSLPSYFCEFCNMRFSSSQVLQKHTSIAHGFLNHTYNNYNYLMMPEVMNNGKIYCVYCGVFLESVNAFTEHCLVVHNPYQTHLMGLNPQEQIKPTDLSIARKTPTVKRPTNDEQQLSPKKKYKSNENSSNYNSNLYNQSETFMCGQCNASYANFDFFRAHVKLHIEESTARGLLGGATPPERKRTPIEFTCPHCREVFSSSEEISQHVIAHFLSPGTTYSCENCHKFYDKADELQKHLMESHAQHLYSCSICNEVFDSKVTIQLHFAVRHQNEAKVYRCSGCPKSPIVYHSELEFATHVKTEHTNPSSLLTTFTSHYKTPMLCCLICHMNFSNELEMQLHLPTHGKQFQCSLCPQSFQIEYLLDKHMHNQHSSPINTTHDSEDVKELSCIVSPNSHFNNPSAKTENEEHKVNLFYCDTCEKGTFATEVELMNHKKIYHLKVTSPGKLTSENPENNEERSKTSQKYNCSNSSSPNIGIKKADLFNVDNNGNATIICDACGKHDFMTEAELQSHKKLMHHVKQMSPGKVRLQCAYCHEHCKSRIDLENHMKIHSQNSSTCGKHKCNICDEMCPTAVVLAKHKLTHCKVIKGDTCMQCKGSVTNEEQFYSHLQQHSPPNTNTNNNGTFHLNQPTVCVICRQTLSSDMEARIHVKFHLQQPADLIPCSECRQMWDKQDLITGICRECYRRHGKSSPFQCPECNMNFENGTAIEIHL